MTTKGSQFTNKWSNIQKKKLFPMVKYLFDVIDKNNFNTKREAQTTVTLKGIRSD